MKLPADFTTKPGTFYYQLKGSDSWVAGQWKHEAIYLAANSEIMLRVGKMLVTEKDEIVMPFRTDKKLHRRLESLRFNMN